MLRAAWLIMPASLAYFTDNSRLRVSFRPQNERIMSTPWAFFTLGISWRTSFGTPYMRSPFNARSSMWVWIPALLNSRVQARTDLLGFSPYIRFTCSKAPPLVSTRSKQPMSTIAGAICSNWSLRGWYLPDDCHISRYTRLNFISLAISCCIVYCSICLFCNSLREKRPSPPRCKSTKNIRFIIVFLLSVDKKHPL